MRWVGEECVVGASDYPHPDSHYPVEASLATMGELPATTRRKLFAENAARLYGIDVPG